MEDFEYIKGYENLYKINRKGEIFSCWYSKIMKPLITHDGYLYIHLKKEKKRFKGYIHRLIATQFIPNEENKPQVDHIDRNKLNNQISNLRWVTNSEQCLNRSNCLSLLSDDEKEQKIKDKREYKRLWAEQNRRNKGIKIREFKNKDNDT